MCCWPGWPRRWTGATSAGSAVWNTPGIAIRPPARAGCPLACRPWRDRCTPGVVPISRFSVAFLPREVPTVPLAPAEAGTDGGTRKGGTRAQARAPGVARLTLALLTCRGRHVATRFLELFHGEVFSSHFH